MVIMLNNVYKITLLLILIYGCNFSGSNRNKDQDEDKNQKLNGSITVVPRSQIDSTSYLFGLKISDGKYSVYVETICYEDSLYDENISSYSDRNVKKQTLFFMKNDDTLSKHEVVSRTDTIVLKKSTKSIVTKANVLKFLAVVKGKQDFFYYLEGGEDCIFPCTEYWAFYTKDGVLLWQLYTNEMGDYKGTINKYLVDSSIYDKNSIIKYVVFPYENLGEKIESSMIKSAK